MKKLCLCFILFFIFYGCTPHIDPYDELYDAIRKNDIQKVEKILNSGIDINPSTKHWTPLMIAVLRSNITMVDMFLKKGAYINARNNKGQTPLHIAARWGKPEIVEYLIDKGANIEARDWLSWTPLMWASLRGREEVVKILLKYGADVNVIDIDKNTPLILAAWHGHKNVISLLLKNGADKRLKNIEGFTACDIARKKEFNEALLLLGECNN
jgi:ankyrin repeat protein